MFANKAPPVCPNKKDIACKNVTLEGTTEAGGSLNVVPMRRSDPQNRPWSPLGSFAIYSLEGGTKASQKFAKCRLSGSDLLRLPPG
jgi:hypothetical protein